MGLGFGLWLVDYAKFTLVTLIDDMNNKHALK